MDNLAEERFKDWLDKNQIPYWYIDQSLDSFSPALKRLMIKRPDFLVLLPNFGLIFVDVKDKSQAEKYDKFFMDTEEVDKYSSMQNIFNMRVWFVISNQNYHYKTWFWIPVSDVTRSGFVSQSSKSGENYYSIPTDQFVQVADSDNLSRLFNKLLKF